MSTSRWRSLTRPAVPGSAWRSVTRHAVPGSAWRSVTRLAGRAWRVPLILAAIVFALSGPAHSLGRVDMVFYASLGGVTLGGIGVALGCLALLADPARRPRPEGEEPA